MMGRKPRAIKKGDVFFDLTFIKELKPVEFNCGQKVRLFLCKCVCGNKVKVIGSNLFRGSTKSCGCRRKLGTRHTHGKSKTSEYISWASLRSRCVNKNDKSYKNYGGRGIKVCDRWKNSFENFYKDMGNKPSKMHSIDRINNEGDYEPKNCKWSTNIQQANNRRSSVKYKYNGENRTISEWGSVLKLNKELIRGRLKRGWSFEASICTKKRKWRGI